MKKLFLLLLLVVPCFAYSQENTNPMMEPSDGGMWSSLQVNKFWESGAYAFFRGEHRSCEKFSATECFFTSIGGGYSFTKWLRSDLSYEFWRLYPAASTTHKAVLAVTGELRREGLTAAIREKLELSFMEDGSIGWNLRSRLRVQYRIGNGVFRPYIMAELFSWDKWRRSLNYVGTDIFVGKHSAFDLFYMYNLCATSAACHTLGVGYTFNF